MTKKLAKNDYVCPQKHFFLIYSKIKHFKVMVC